MKWPHSCYGGPGADAVLGAAVAGPRHPGHRGPDHQLCGGQQDGSGWDTEIVWTDSNLCLCVSEGQLNYPPALCCIPEQEATVGATTQEIRTEASTEAPIEEGDILCIG